MTRPGRPLRLAPLLLLFAALLAAPLDAQRGRPFAVSVDRAAGGVPLVSLRGVLRDRALRDALESGLPVRLQVRVDLWEKGLVDRLAGADEVQLAVLRDPLGDGYLLEDGSAEAPCGSLDTCEDAVEAALGFVLAPDGRGRFYYLATLDVETLSASDLDELRRWLRGEARPAVEGRTPVGRAVGRGLRRAFVRLLNLPTRHYEARTGEFRGE